ncbi:MAG: hypothetical protein MRECE_5c028 [Mycoplasmataceae bacterium CE_OT135]|nr:MAG: hypothetical protein MRECE_6c046 [Mycoplasmataceae bacterium CE_OT135]KLL03984.1 MAG: hypothetical protein MRECE_5c028 [Mycoplasmataceae bacterium CE_OT135]
MSREERKAKLQAAKEKLENWQSSLSEMEKFIEKTHKELDESFVGTQEKPPSPEEAKELRELLKEIEGNKEAKILDSIDDWAKGSFRPKDEDIDLLEIKLINKWSTLIQIRELKRSGKYEKNEGIKKEVDAWEEEFDNFKPYWEKIFSLSSQRYIDKNTSSSDKKSANPTTLPWTLAIVFGITTIIAAGAAIYLFWHQRKIKRFKV